MKYSGFRAQKCIVDDDIVMRAKSLMGLPSLGEVPHVVRLILVIQHLGVRSFIKRELHVLQ